MWVAFWKGDWLMLGQNPYCLWIICCDLPTICFSDAWSTCVSHWVCSWSCSCRSLSSHFLCHSIEFQNFGCFGVVLGLGWVCSLGSGGFVLEGLSSSWQIFLLRRLACWPHLFLTPVWGVQFG